MSFTCRISGNILSTVDDQSLVSFSIFSAGSEKNPAVCHNNVPSIQRPL